MQHKLTFSKSERLTGEIRIKNLFEKGNFMLSYPFRVGYMTVPKTDIPAKILISAPKKRFKHAVDRNRIKRMIRETYRLNKQALYDVLIEKDYSILLSVNYISSDKLSYDIIEKKWMETLHKLSKNLP